MRPEATPPSGKVTAMPTPRLNEKRWSIDLEKRIQEEHYSDPDAYNARYAFDAQSEREPFVIDTPPPYPSGTWHIGAVAQYSMIDVIAGASACLARKSTSRGASTGTASTSNSPSKRTQTQDADVRPR